MAIQLIVETRVVNSEEPDTPLKIRGMPLRTTVLLNEYVHLDNAHADLNRVFALEIALRDIMNPK